MVMLNRWRNLNISTVPIGAHSLLTTFIDQLLGDRTHILAMPILRTFLFWAALLLGFNARSFVKVLRKSHPFLARLHHRAHCGGDSQCTSSTAGYINVVVSKHHRFPDSLSDRMLAQTSVAEIR